MSKDNELLSCRECSFKLTFEGMLKAGAICPSCKEETSWFSEPEFFGFEDK